MEISLRSAKLFSLTFCCKGKAFIGIAQKENPKPIGEFSYFC